MSGAVYRPVEETVPHVGPTHPAPLMLQVTLLFVLPVTVAVNCREAPATTSAVVGDMATAISCVIVTMAELDLVESATEVAVTLTKEGLGGVEGAV